MIKFEEMPTIPTKPLMADGVVYRPSKGGILVPDVSSQVGKGQTKVQQALENTPLEQLRQSTHPRAQALITWIESDKENKKWYLENVGTKFDLVQDGIFLLGNTLELEDEKAEKNPEKGIGNNNGHTYFSFDAQKELFGDNVPKKDDWVNLKGFLPGDDANIVEFLTKVLGLNLTGLYYFGSDTMVHQGQVGNYGSSTECDDFNMAYIINFGVDFISITTTLNKLGRSVRCFKK